MLHRYEVDIEARKRDVLVAEKIFGWRVEWGFGHDNPKPWNEVEDVQLHHLSLTPPDCSDGSGHLEYIPHYSTDIAAAWLVVERITRVPQSVEEATQAANTHFMHWFSKSWLCCYNSAAAAEAICIAALDAKSRGPLIFGGNQ